MTAVIPVRPHGGRLPRLRVSAQRRAWLRDRLLGGLSWTLDGEQLADLELLLSGAYAPLTGYMGRHEVEAVCERMRLPDGTLWPLPIVLEVDAELGRRISRGVRLALHHPEGPLLAALRVTEVWRPDRAAIAAALFGTLDPGHPGVAAWLERPPTAALAGRLEEIEAPHHPTFRDLRLTPRALRRRLAATGRSRVLAFHTREPIHRPHFELTLAAARELDAHLLLHPALDEPRPGEVDAFTRIRTYRVLLPRYPAGAATLALLPLARRQAGPREALLDALVRQNFGCSHFLVDPWHGDPGAAAGRPFHPAGTAYELLRRHAGELAIEPVPAASPWAPDPGPILGPGEVRRRLDQGRGLPVDFTFHEVAAELIKAYPPRSRQGLAIFFTGLSGSGKSAIVEAIHLSLRELGGRRVSVLDGAEIREILAGGLGFSARHRELNLRRLGFVAAEIARHGGIALAAPVAALDRQRKAIRSQVEACGGFVLVHVATSLGVCQERDPKGLYARARAGRLRPFPGLTEPYEIPADAELRIETVTTSPAAASAAILRHLVREGYLAKA